MRRIALTLLAAISLAAGAVAATRPHYGGTVSIEMQSAPMKLEMPSLSATTDYWDMARLLSLTGDTLVRIDAEGRPLPALAIAWQTDQSARHWQFTLQRGIRFQDGSQASPAAIAQILGALHPEWNVRAGPSVSDSLAIDTETAAPSLLAELALPRNFIITRNAAGVPVGSGAFRIVDFQPGKFVKLAASESNWAGRPFVDAIDIELGKSLRDQAVALELGRADASKLRPSRRMVRPTPESHRHCRSNC